MRTVLVMSVLCVAACDPVYTSGVVLAPRPVISVDSLRQAAALALVGRVAARRGLEPAPKFEGTHAGSRCFAREPLVLCARAAAGGEVRFELTQRPAGLSESTGFRRELADSLRAAFGAASVVECDWRNSLRDWRAHCPPAARADSGRRL